MNDRPPPPTPEPQALPTGSAPLSIPPPFLSLPFILLKRGNVTYLLYSGTIVGFAIYGLQFLHSYLARWIRVFGLEFGTSDRALSHFQLAGGILTWSLLVPVIIATLVLPARILFMRGRVPIEELLDETLSSLQIATAATYLAVRRGFVFGLPALFMYVLYHSWVVRQSSLAVYETYTAAAILVALICLVKLIALLCSPIAAVCGQMAPAFAVFNAQAIYQKHLLQLLLVVVGAGAAIGATMYSKHGTRIDLSSISTSEWGLYGVIVWYAITLIAFLTLRQLASMQASPP